jgi:cell division septation protein DedD
VIKAVRGGLYATLVAGALGAGGPALADVKAGVDAWASGDYAAAVREWQGPAAAGDPDAQFNLAQAYKLGRGVPRDLTRAENLYAAAAAKGHLQAGDNYGLLLFNRGERTQAMPYIRAAAGRGDARAQYILGLAMFNGDGMAKDWVRAYAYVSLAQQAGLPQATSALAQMDQHVTMADRQKSVAVAAQIAADTESTRARQVAATDLSSVPGAASIAVAEPGAPPARAATSRPVLAANDRAATDAARAASAARDAGTTRVSRAAPPVVSTPARRPAPPAPTPAQTAAVATPASGRWRLQLGAFGVPGNAEALWARVKARPELAGHGRLLIATGKLTRLQATGFASQAEASSACARMKAGGFACLATRD